MKIHYDIEQLPTFRNAVLTIGSFDGVHLGHQKIIKQINDLAASIDGESVLISFYPHPRLVLNPADQSLKLLHTLDEKAVLLAQYKVDHLVIVPFSLEFANQSPQTYLKNFLIAKFQPQIIVIGYDHKFGKNRAGNIDYLRQFEIKYQFKIVEISKHEVADIAVSSTKVRKAIEQGKIAKAADLLGHYPCLSGKVAKGLQIGATIGYPTANLEAVEAHQLIPPKGIYAVYVQHQNKTYQGMLYIGSRPTIGGNLKETIEVNIFDFNQSIYGESLTILFVKRLREDIKFKGLDLLQQQLKKDKKTALAALNILHESQ